MGNCFKTQHQLLADQEKQLEALANASLTLAEIAHRYQTRKEDIEHEIATRAKAINTVVQEFQRGVHERADAERLLTDLELKQSMAVARHHRANANVIMYEKHKTNVLELQATMENAAKMNQLVGSLKKIGVKVDSLEANNNKVERLMDKLRDATENNDEFIADSNLDLQTMGDEASEKAKSTLDRLDTLKGDLVARELDSLPRPNAKGYKMKAAHVIAEPSGTLRGVELEVDSDEEEEGGDGGGEHVFAEMS